MTMMRSDRAIVARIMCSIGRMETPLSRCCAINWIGDLDVGGCQADHDFVSEAGCADA